MTLATGGPQFPIDFSERANYNKENNQEKRRTR